MAIKCKLILTLRYRDLLMNGEKDGSRGINTNRKIQTRKLESCK